MKKISQDSMDKRCPRCGDTVTGRKKYCCDSCKFWHNLIRKEKESHLPPVRKRNENFFQMVTGSKRAAGRGQGKRIGGGMVVGSMSAMVSVTIEETVEVTPENIKKHFSGIPGYSPAYMKLGSGEIIKKEDVQKRFGIEIN